MTRYHLSENGPQPCRAQDMTRCPYAQAGGSHFENLAEAQQVYERDKQEEFGTLNGVNKQESSRNIEITDLQKELGEDSGPDLDEAPIEFGERFAKCQSFADVGVAYNACKPSMPSGKDFSDFSDMKEYREYLDNEKEKRTIESLKDKNAWKQIFNNSSDNKDLDNAAFNEEIKGEMQRQNPELYRKLADEYDKQEWDISPGTEKVEFPSSGPNEANVEYNIVSQDDVDKSPKLQKLIKSLSEDDKYRGPHGESEFIESDSPKKWEKKTGSSLTGGDQLFIQSGGTHAVLYEKQTDKRWGVYETSGDRFSVSGLAFK